MISALIYLVIYIVVLALIVGFCLPDRRGANP